jgi:AmpD protein
MSLDLATGLLDTARYITSPNCDNRDSGNQVQVIIVHCISLPPGQYGGDQVIDFFTNQLDCSAHEYFKEIEGFEVSTHFYIRRSGELIQFVPTNKRAWHAGQSTCLGKPKVNNFSIGVELEGLDTDPAGFTLAQYSQLGDLKRSLMQAYPQIENNNLFAHSDIAPGRKLDPGPYFDWSLIL